MMPAPGERLLRFVGDTVRFELKLAGPAPAAGSKLRARLRTNLGRAAILRHEIIQAHARGVPLAGASWRDLPMRPQPGGWSLELPLAEAGFFKAKAYLLDERGWQHWPEGPDVGIAVHPDAYRTANTLYCAFPRMFGTGKTASSTVNEPLENQIRQIEKSGYSIIPASGKLRDLIPCLPHIIGRLGCRILHLLPIHPTPTTYARFGRFGSPYAALDFTAVDPALVVFDRRRTGIDQFCELSYATHARGGRLLLDIVINHTGWGSTLQEQHPEWFLKNPDGTFASPGAWGVTWEDLVELKHVNVDLWDSLAENFLTWCRRGVDGFRCDAGYKVPVAAWQYIIARVQQQFPDTIFLLEGLGGSWEATESLLTEGGMQWAYSELFQNYSGAEVSAYLDYALRQSRRVGLYVHYSETHDNDRLAKRGPAWSLLRNRLCALASVGGGFGFTCGVEWLATEKIRVHGCTGLAWDSTENLVPELAQLNRLLATHPCFFDGATLQRLSPADSPIYALLRVSSDGRDSVLVLVNTDIDQPHSLSLPETVTRSWPSLVDLLGQPLPQHSAAGGQAHFTLAPGEAFCLSGSSAPMGLSGEPYRRERAQAAWAVQALSRNFFDGEIDGFDWRALAALVEQSPFDFLAALPHLDRDLARSDIVAALERVMGLGTYPQVVRWSLADCRRVTPVPANHWLLLEDSAPFRAELRIESPGADPPWNVHSIASGTSHVACFAPRQAGGNGRLVMERYDGKDPHVEAAVRFLMPDPPPGAEPAVAPADSLILLTNGIGGMARLCVGLGRVNSKYDCVLGANLDPSLPVDRHIFAKRIRVWVNAEGFLSPLELQNLASFTAGPPATWRFVANAGDGRTVEVTLRAEMPQDRNTTLFHFSRPTAARATGKQLPADSEVRLTVRVDIEDRNFHWETKRDGAAEFHFASHTHPLPQAALAGSQTPAIGFAFTPASDRHLTVLATAGEYHPQPEWCENIPHPVEQSRGQVSSGDAYSPGWFEIPLPKGASATVAVTAEEAGPGVTIPSSHFALEPPAGADAFGEKLLRAARQFVVRRGSGKTVIAGYPWFLDWGRDTLVCARGLLAGGLVEEVREILVTFARFEKEGTLPNALMGDNATNRDTSDAPLWFGLACQQLAGLPQQAQFYQARVESGRCIADVLRSIATHYLRGTPNGIRVDPGSGLVWSPAHFTWMDTNHPAGTPREGYPVEIQALWIRLLRLLAGLSHPPEASRWNTLAGQALASVEQLFWLEQRGWYADVLLAKPGEPASGAPASDALRSNCLFLAALGLGNPLRAKRCVAAAGRFLLVPGALRSLAPLPVQVPLPVFGNNGGLINDPPNPYWPRYEGDEDTRRKPAYHNGTAWTWSLPVFCEALARAWDFSPEAVAAARAYLRSTEQLMERNCLGQVPEILDGDAPHTQRGCDAQAWGVTEALRVWKLLGSENAPRDSDKIRVDW